MQKAMAQANTTTITSKSSAEGAKVLIFHILK
jgi:hypothetical protein